MVALRSFMGAAASALLSAGSSGGGGNGGDPDFDSVVMLAGFEGTDGDTSSLDESNSAHALTFNGEAQLDDSVAPPFGTTSLFVQRGVGDDDYVTAPTSPDFEFGDQPFTIELFIRIQNRAGNFSGLLTYWDTSTGNRCWQVVNADPDVTFWRSSTGDNFTALSSAESLSTDTWYWIVIDRDTNDDLRVYVDGVMVAKENIGTFSFFDASTTLTFGARSNPDGFFDGWIKEVRITKGVARYGSDGGMPVPTEPFPRASS